VISSCTLCVRLLDGSVVEASIGDVGLALFEESQPWRTFRSWKGQRHYSGLYWSATMKAHVIYESRLELAFLLFADRDPTVVRIFAQPFLLTASIDGAKRRHVPDFLIVHRDSAASVVDVKPLSRKDRPAVAGVLGWSARAIATRGWGFEVWSDPDAQLLANVRFLSGYRRPELFREQLLASIRATLAAPLTLREVEAALEAEWPAMTVRPHVLHLLWLNELIADLERPLGSSTIVRTAMP
jgi:hypothetical protein